MTRAALDCSAADWTANCVGGIALAEVGTLCAVGEGNADIGGGKTEVVVDGDEEKKEDEDGVDTGGSDEDDEAGVDNSARNEGAATATAAVGDGTALKSGAVDSVDAEEVDDDDDDDKVAEVFEAAEAAATSADVEMEISVDALRYARFGLTNGCAEADDNADTVDADGAAEVKAEAEDEDEDDSSMPSDCAPACSRASRSSFHSSSSSVSSLPPPSTPLPPPAAPPPAPVFVIPNPTPCALRLCCAKRPLKAQTNGHMSHTKYFSIS